GGERPPHCGARRFCRCLACPRHGQAQRVPRKHPTTLGAPPPLNRGSEAKVSKPGRKKRAAGTKKLVLFDIVSKFTTWLRPGRRTRVYSPTMRPRDCAFPSLPEHTSRRDNIEMNKLPDPPLLVVTDRQQARLALADVVRAALSAGCRWVSMREKDLSQDDQIALAST